MIDGLQLRALHGLEDSPFRAQLSGAEYVCESNPMGIEKFSFVFEDTTKGIFRYTKALYKQKKSKKKIF